MKFKLFGRLKDGDQEGNKDQNRSRRSSGSSIPQEKIESMSQRGLSENEIREELRDSGYSHQQIDSALNQTVKRNAVSGSGSNYGGSRGGSLGQAPASFGGDSGASPNPDQSGFSPFSGSQEPEDQGGSLSGEGGLGGLGAMGSEDREMGESGEGRKDDLGGGYPDEGSYPDETVSAEGVPSNARELIEIMVAEELSDIDERFDQIHSRMGKLEESVSSLEEKVNELSTRREEDEKEFLKRIKDMEGYLKESQSTVGGLKKTMQDVLPALSRNIKEMNKIIEEKEK